MLPESITMRALAHMENGLEPIEAVKMAIEEENNLIWLCLGVDMKTGFKSDVSKEVIDIMSQRVYDRIRANH